MKTRSTRLLLLFLCWFLGGANLLFASPGRIAAPPAAPTGLTATVVSSTEIGVSWTAPTGATTYDLDYSTDATFATNTTTLTGLTGTSQNFTTLTPNTTYYFQVRAVNVDGSSGNSSPTSGLTKPGAPTLGSFTNVTTSGVRVTWTPDANGQAGFALDRATDAGFSQNLTTTTYGGSATFDDVSGLAENTQYYFRVRATNASGASANSGSGSVTTLLGLPAAPSGLNASAASTSQINLTWTDNATNETAYEVWRSTDGTSFTKIADLGANSASYPATGLTDATLYYFKVQATNATGASGFSNTASAATQFNVVNDLAASAASSSQINLTWTDNSTTETGYEVLQATSAGGPFNVVATTAADATGYNVTGLNQNTAYYFQVRAKNSTGTAPVSNTASATTLYSPPAAPSGLSASAVSNTQIDLTWTNNATNAVSVEVDRSPDGTNFTNIASLGSGATTYPATGLSGNTQYWFRVRAKNPAGEAPSNVANATTLPDPPGVPQNFAASAVEATTLTLSWSAPGSGGAVGNYELQLPVAPNTVTQTGTTYNVTGLTPGTNYTFGVRAQNAGGVSNFVNTAALTKPGKPTGLSASTPAPATGITQLNLSWTSPGGVVDAYEVDQATSSGGPWTTVANNVTATNYAATGLTANTTYFFRVRAKNSSGLSVNSDNASATTLPNPPADPTGLAITQPVTSTTQLALTWTDNATNETAYEVERADNGGGFSKIADLGANTTGYTATGLSANNAYAFRVRAKNAGGNSGYSNEPSALTLPDTPGGLNASVPGPPDGRTKIDLSWNGVGGPGALTYELDYGTAADFTGATTVNNLSATTYQLTSLTPNATYYVRVRARNASGASASSGSASATTLPNPPADPTGLAASATSTSQINLTWTDAATNETAYEVWRSTTDNSNYAKITDLGANSASYPSTGLSSNTTYFYKVRATNSGGESNFSNETSALTYPDAPGSLSVSVPAAPDGQTKLNLSWTPPSGTLTGYDLEYATNAGFTGSSVAAVAVGNSYQLTGLTQNTTYYLRLRAKNATGSSANSNAVSATTLPDAPATPTGLSASAISSTGFTANWTAPAGPLTGYVLDVATDNAFASVVQTLNPGSGSTSQAISGLTPNTTYYFRLKAQNTGGESAYTGAATAITLPSAPTGLSVSAVTTSGMTVSWNVVSGLDYELKYSVNADLSGATTVNVPAPAGPTTSQVLTGLAQNATYYLQVRAKNGTGFSDPASTQQLTLPNPPTGVAVQGGSVQSTQLTLTWTAPGGSLEKYDLRYSTNSDAEGGVTTDVSGSATSQVVSGLTPNTTYYLKLRAKNATGFSDFSAPIVQQLTLPAAPSGLAVQGGSVTTSGLTLTWTAPASNPAGYELSISPNPGVTLPIQLAGTATTCAVTGLAANTNYTFQLRAKNGTGFSDPTSVSQLTLPAQPQGLSITGIQARQVTVQWNAPTSNPDSYELRYSTDAGLAGAILLTPAGSATSQVVTGLQPNTRYYFQLKAKNGTGVSDPTPTINQLTLPDAPANFQVTGGSQTTSGLTVQWSAPASNPDGYQLRYSPNADLSGATTLTPAGSATSQAITGLSANTTYYFELKAQNGTGQSDPATTQGLTQPGAPTLTSASAISATGLTLNWTAPGGNGTLTNYLLEYSTDPAIATGVQTLNPGGGSTSQAISGLSANTTYYFQLKAQNASGYSGYSNKLSVLTRPAAPTNLQQTYVKQTAVNVQWTPPAGTLTGYQLQVATDNGFSNVVQTPTPGGGASSFGVTGLSQNTTYYLRIRAKNTGDESGYGDYSNVIQVQTPPDPPGAPTLTNATGLTQTQMTINWTGSSGIVNGYSLEFSKSNTFSPVDSLVTNDANATKQQVTGLTSKTTYYFRLRGFNQGGHSVYSNTLSVQTLPDPPSQPTAFQVTGFTQTTVSLSWQAPATGDQTGYEIQYTTDPNFGGTVPSLNIANAAVLSATVQNLQPYTTYYFRLRAINAGGGSTPASAQQQTLPNPPAAPTNLSASAVTQTGFTVNWTAPAGPVTSYELDYGTAQNFAGATTIAIADGTATSQALASLTQNTTYYVRIRAKNTGGTGANSDVLTVLTLPNAPAAPTNLAANAIGPSGLTLTWSAPAGPITGYVVQYSTASDFSASPQQVTVGNSTSQAITGLSPNTTYYFRVKAQNAGGESAYSTPPLSVITLPGAPGGLVASNVTTTSMSLNWTPPGGTVTSYQLDVATNAGFSGATTISGITTLPYALTGLSQNTTYYLRVRAVNTTGNSDNSPSISVLTLPNPPGNLSASGVTATSVTLTWAGPGGSLDSYELVVSTGGNPVQTLTPVGSATSQVVSGLTANTSYSFQLRAKNSQGFSTPISINQLTLPGAPSGLSASAVSQTSFNLSWSLPGGTLTAQEVQYATNSGFTGATVLPIADGTTTNTTLTGLSANTTYFVRVVAKNGTGSSDPSTPISVLTLPNPPAAPTNLSASNVSQQSLTVSWSTPGGPLTGYVLDMATDNGFTSIVQTLNPGSGATSQGVSGLTANTTYYFRLKAQNNGGESAYSATLQTTTLPNLPGAPTAFTAAPVSSSQINLSWTNGGGQTALELQVSTNSNFSSGVQTLPLDASATTTSVTGLAENTTYYFRLRGQNVAGYSGYAQTQGTTFLNPPAAPSGLSANATSPNTVQLNWTDNATNEGGFYVEQSTAGGGFTQIAQLGPNTTTLTVNGLSENTPYAFRVRAFNAAGTSNFSNTASVTTPYSLPAAPSNLSAQTQSQTVINLNWQNNAGNATGYEVEQSTDGTNFGRVAQLGAGATSFQATNLNVATNYTFRVRAVNPAGGSGYSNTASAQTLPFPPAPPSGLAAVPLSQTVVQLNWTDNANNETGFEIERSTDGTNFSGSGNAGANSTQAQVSGLKASTRYFFRLRAVNAGGASAYSNVVDVITLPDAPNPPSDLAASDTTQTTVRLTWKDNAGDETAVEVFQADSAKGTLRRITILPPNTTTYLVPTLLVDKVYRFAVRMTNSGGASAFSNEISVRTLPFPPEAPTQVQARALSQTTIRLLWRNPAGALTQTRVEQSLDGKTFTLLKTLPPNVETTNADSLKQNTVYWYRLQSVNRAGRSVYSAIVRDTTLSYIPVAPTNLRADNVQPRQIRLKWTDNSDNESAFEIEQFVQNRFLRVNTAPANADTITIRGLTDQTEYRFRVRAANRTGASSYSNELTVTTPLGLPDAPVNLQVINDRGGPVIGLKWQIPNRRLTDSVEVERGTDGTTFQLIAKLVGNADSTIVNGLDLGTKYFFRVRAKNKTGASPYSNVAERRSVATGLEEERDLAAVHVQPNPVEDQVLVETDSPKTFLRVIEGYNTLGQRMFRYDVSGQERSRQLSLGHLPAGVYILSVETTQGVTRQKLLKR
jgi:titin